MSANLAIATTILPLGSLNPTSTDPAATKPSHSDNADATSSADFAAMLCSMMPTSIVPLTVQPDPSTLGNTTGDSALATVGPLTDSSGLLQGSPGLLTQALPAGSSSALLTTSPLQVDLSLQQQNGTTPQSFTLPPDSLAAQTQSPTQTQVTGSPAAAVTTADLQELVASFTQLDTPIDPTLSGTHLAGDKTSMATMADSLGGLLDTAPVGNVAPVLPQSLLGQVSTVALTDPTSQDETSPSPEDADAAADSALLADAAAVDAGGMSLQDLVANGLDPTNEIKSSSVELTTAKGDPAQQAPVDQVGQEVEAMVNHGRHQVNLNLNPENLGSVRIHLQRTADGQMSARFVVERPEAMAQLQANTHELTEKLAGQGIQLNKVDWVLAGQTINSSLNAPARVEATTQSAASQNAGEQTPSGNGAFHQNQHHQNQQQQQAQMLFQQGQQQGQRWGAGQQSYATQPQATPGVLDGNGGLITNELPATGGPAETQSGLRNGAGRINLQV